MDSLLRYAYVEEPCPACGGKYVTTLLDALMEHRVHEEWKSPRPCSVCAGESSAFSARIPREMLDRLDSAWTEIRDAANAAGFPLSLGLRPEVAARAAPPAAG